MKIAFNKSYDEIIMTNRSGEIPRPLSAQKFAMSHKWFFLSERGDRSLAVWQSGKFCWFC